MGEINQIGLNSLHWFLRYDVHKVYGMHRLTDLWTDTPINRMPPVTKVFGGGGIVNIKILMWYKIFVQNTEVKDLGQFCTISTILRTIARATIDRTRWNTTN